MFKKIIYIFFLVFFVTSCADTFDSVKRGITGQKQQSTDEFLIQKKDMFTGKVGHIIVDEKASFLLRSELHWGLARELARQEK